MCVKHLCLINKAYHPLTYKLLSAVGINKSQQQKYSLYRSWHFVLLHLKHLGKYVKGKFHPMHINTVWK